MSVVGQKARTRIIKLHTSVACVLSVLQFVGQEPHHAARVDKALVDVVEPVSATNQRR